MFYIDFNGNINHKIKLKYQGDLLWKILRYGSYHYNTDLAVFRCIKKNVVLSPNTTISYWMFGIAKDVSHHFVEPKMFTILGDGNLTDEYRPLEPNPSDDYYGPAQMFRWNGWNESVHGRL